MNFLSKQLSIGLLALSSGVMLQGAATTISSPNFQELCFQAQERCSQNVSGYCLQTEPIQSRGLGHATGVKAQLIIDHQPGYSVNTVAQPCVLPRSFCSPSTEMLHEDDLVRVIKKPGSRPGTDLLITSKEHICNTHALERSNGTELLKRIGGIAAVMADYLPEDATYTLMTNNGEHRQRISHLHVHFNSDALLNEQGFKATMTSFMADRARLDNSHDQTITEPAAPYQPIVQPIKFTMRHVVATVATLGVVAVAAYKLYSWWKSR